jgi:hypothetical protein
MAWWLKAVPWSMIIANAPALVEGARKLLDKRRMPDAAEAPGNGDPVVQRLAALEGRERKVLELIESLAQSNQQLIVAVQLLQRRMRLALGAGVVLAVMLAIALVQAFQA